MKQGRETTLEERIKIVLECIAGGKNYGEMPLRSKAAPGLYSDQGIAMKSRGILLKQLAAYYMLLVLLTINGLRGA